MFVYSSFSFIDDLTNRFLWKIRHGGILSGKMKWIHLCESGVGLVILKIVVNNENTVNQMVQCTCGTSSKIGECLQKCKINSCK